MLVCTVCVRVRMCVCVCVVLVCVKFENHKLSAMWVGLSSSPGCWVTLPSSCRILFISLRPRAHNRNVNGSPSAWSWSFGPGCMDRGVSYTVSVCLEALRSALTCQDTHQDHHLGTNHKRIVQVFRATCGQVCERVLCRQSCCFPLPPFHSSCCFPADCLSVM